MPDDLHRRRLLQAGLALCMVALAPRVRACEFMTPTLRVTHPWTRATGHDATTAVLCMRFDEVSEADRLILVETPVATSAEMGGALARPTVDFLIPQGEETYLDDSGTFVRLLGLTQPLQLGRSYPLRLGFEKGGVFNTTLGVDFGRFR
ncbi:MAG: copper chaperone PCu(A)C [Rubrivivax sp.]|nr:copper chaperone PCu(A)C [Rubrivivax sp.]